MSSAISLDAELREVVIVCGCRRVRGMLTLPENLRGLVVFAHGSGSSRFSPRNRHVAECLNARGLGTLLVDLLEEEEAADRECVFNIPRLVDRLEAATEWLGHESGLHEQPLGLFGASTGAAAALATAASNPSRIRAVVCRGGRPDLVSELLPTVATPTLFIVGGADELVLELNRAAFERLAGPRELAVVPGATHLFPEPGALDQVATLAGRWFLTHFDVAAEPQDEFGHPPCML
jgi:putative phosphoribosyl transferase